MNDRESKTLEVAGFTTYMIIAVLVGLGISRFGVAFEQSVTSPYFWLQVAVGVFFLFLAWALFKILRHYQKEVDRYASDLYYVLTKSGYRDMADFNRKHQTDFDPSA